VHIGKQSGGWQFHFRGYRESEKWELPEGVPCLTSTDDWRELLARADVRIYDEYGAEVEAAQFWEGVEASKGRLTTALYDARYADNPTEAARQARRECGDEWTDIHGWEFASREFS
jgi:hypothetical protein